MPAASTGPVRQLSNIGPTRQTMTMRIIACNRNDPLPVPFDECSQPWATTLDIINQMRPNLVLYRAIIIPSPDAVSIATLRYPGNCASIRTMASRKAPADLVTRLVTLLLRAIISTCPYIRVGPSCTVHSSRRLFCVRQLIAAGYFAQCICLVNLSSLRYNKNEHVSRSSTYLCEGQAMAVMVSSLSAGRNLCPRADPLAAMAVGAVMSISSSIQR